MLDALWAERRSAKVHLGAVAPDQVRVEAYHGEADNGGIKNPGVTVLDGSSPAEGEGNYVYQGSVPASDSGTYGFSRALSGGEQDGSALSDPSSTGAVTSGSP